MVSLPNPTFTVIIPTYNWSAALACAIQSVLGQTLQDFEILVVGDGCTDDSADVVARFNDPRIRWHNLDRNYGSQWMANNWAIENACGTWVAYLGHDDIWYPTHLEAIQRAANAAQTDLVTSVMILYGPPGSGVSGVAGVFATGTYTPRDFVPPSAFAHKKTLYGDAIKWQNPDNLELPIDAVFFNSLITSGKLWASTQEVTCFKFNAAWRRDSYKIKSVAEQESFLARIHSGDDFRQQELLGVLQSALADKMCRVGMTSPQGLTKGWIVERNQKFKGTKARYDAANLSALTRRTRFYLHGQDMPFEWHRLEHRGLFRRTYRWTGPSRRSTIDLPVRFDRDLAARIRVRRPVKPALLDTLTVSVHGQPCPHRIVHRGEKDLDIAVEIRHDATAATGRDFGITLEVAETVRPCDIDPTSGDTRAVGLPVYWVELAPLPP